MRPDRHPGHHRILFVAALLLRAPAAWSQPRRLADTTWQRLTQAPVYAYRTTVENAAVPPPPKPSPFFDGLLWLLHWLGSTAGQILLWVFFGALVLYLVYQLVFGSARFASRKKAAVPVDATEALLDAESLEGDWDARAAAAAAAGDYRSAMRFAYRLLLQRLDATGLIGYEARKSDASYAAELRATAYAAPFRPVLRQYEQVWFGDYPASAETYGRFRTGIQDLLLQLPA